MNAFLLAALLLTSPPIQGETGPAEGLSKSAAASSLGQVSPVEPYRTGRALHRAARESLRRWAHPKADEAQLAAREFLALYGQLQQDTQLARSQRERLRLKIRGRLLVLARQISRRADDQERPKSVGPIDGVLAQARGFGGPARGNGGRGNAARGGQANDDYGPELVELIQETVAPGSWDVNGGAGTIYYWRPGRAIVVRQRGDVHEGIADVLRQMQRLGQ